MNYLAIGILIIVGIIVVASILIPPFQNKIFGGENGEASIGGFITVRGVSFVLLIIGLSGVAAYIELNKKDDLNMTQVISFLTNSRDDSFSLDYVDNDSINVKLNRQLVGSLKQQLDFDIKKSKDKIHNYDVHIEDNNLGDFRLNATIKHLIWKAGDKYYQNQAYRIEESNLWFKIEKVESIKVSGPDGEKYAKYTIRFGEGHREDTIKWTDRTYEYRKTNKGQIPNELKLLSNSSWNNSYAVALGTGVFGGSDDQYHIEQINAMLVIIGIEE